MCNSCEIFLFLSREATAKDEVGVLSNLFYFWKYHVNASSEPVRISTWFTAHQLSRCQAQCCGIWPWSAWSQDFILALLWGGRDEGMLELRFSRYHPVLQIIFWMFRWRHSNPITLLREWFTKLISSYTLGKEGWDRIVNRGISKVLDRNGNWKGMVEQWTQEICFIDIICTWITTIKTGTGRKWKQIFSTPVFLVSNSSLEVTIHSHTTTTFLWMTVFHVVI